MLAWIGSRSCVNSGTSIDTAPAVCPTRYHPSGRPSAPAVLVIQAQDYARREDLQGIEQRISASSWPPSHAGWAPTRFVLPTTS
jgi:hypothetical protein